MKLEQAVNRSALELKREQIGGRAVVQRIGGVRCRRRLRPGGSYISIVNTTMSANLKPGLLIVT